MSPTSVPVVETLVLLVDGPGDGDWWATPVAALAAAGILTRRVALTEPVPPPASHHATGHASGSAAIEAVLLELVHSRVVLVGAGYAAAAICELLGASRAPAVFQAVLVEPAYPHRPGDPGPDAVATLGRLPVPVFLARSRETTSLSPEGSSPGGAGDGVVLRVYPTLAGSLVHADFVDDLLDFLGASTATGS